MDEKRSLCPRFSRPRSSLANKVWGQALSVYLAVGLSWIYQLSHRTHSGAK